MNWYLSNTGFCKCPEKFLGEDTLKDDRFIIAPNRAQSFRSEVLEKDKFNKIIEALSKE
jgi:hypothetical protein